MTEREALKLALEALENTTPTGFNMERDKQFFAAIAAIKEALAQPEQEPVAWETFALKFANGKGLSYEKPKNLPKYLACRPLIYAPVPTSDTSQDSVDEMAKQRHEKKPVAWISVKDALPKAVRGVSYKRSLTDVVLVRHSDRPDYPITAHAVVGEGLGAGVAIPTDGASEHPEIAWYSASCNLNNPFGLKNDDYERYLPKVYGSKITHWKPIDAEKNT